MLAVGQEPTDNSRLVFKNDTLFKVFKGKMLFQRLIQSNDFDTDSFIPIELNSRLYMISGLGGEVLQETEEGLIRIDNSFEHRNQIASTIFVKNDTIFRFGGYGFFDTRNFITYFSDRSKEWEIYGTKSEVFPLGRMSNKYFITDEFLYIIGGSTIDVNDRRITKSIDDVWRFSFLTKKWEFVKDLSALSGLSFSRNDILSSDEFYFKLENDLYSFNLDDFSIYQYDNSQVYGKIDPYFWSSTANDTLFFRLKIPHSNKEKSPIFSIAKKDIRKSELIEEPHKSYSLIIIVSILFLMSTITFLLFQFKRRIKLKKDSISLQDKILKFKGFKISLSDLEVEFMQEFLSNDFVENTRLIDLINSDLDISQKTRIKNTVIHDLNNKLEIVSSGEIEIIKRSSSKDKRFFEYLIKFQSLN